MPEIPELTEANRLSQQVEDLTRQGNYEKALTRAKQVLQAYESALGSEHIAVAGVLSKVAMLYQRKGDYARAQTFYERALTIGEKALGSESPFVAISLSNLASLYADKGDYARAKPLYERALATLEKAFSPEHFVVTKTLNNLAVMYQEMGAYTQAEALYKRALAIREKEFGSDDPDVAIWLASLASLYKAKGDYPRAEQLGQRALRSQEKVLGPDHPQVASTLNVLASIYEALGNFSRAKLLYQRALAVREKALGPEHPNVAESLSNLALFYESTEADYVRAEPLFQRALAIQEKALGPVHPAVAISINNLASLYMNKGDYARAEPLYQRALAIQEKILGPAHPSIATTLNNLAVLYSKGKGDSARAEALDRRALAIREKELGPDHPDVAVSLSNLALLYATRGNYSLAESLDKRALAIREKALGPEHPDVASSLNNLAVLYGEHGDYARATPLYERALAIREKALGPKHPEVAASLINLSVSLWAQGDVPHATQLLLRASDIEEYNLTHTLVAGSERQKRLYLSTVFTTVHKGLALHLHGAQRNASAAQLALTMILRRKGRALDVMTDQISALRRRLDSGDRSLLDNLSSKESQLATLMLDGPKQDNLAGFRAQKTHLVEEIESLEQQIAARSSTFRTQMQPVTINSIRQEIPEGTALVEWMAYRVFDPNWKSGGKQAAQHYAVYVLKSDGGIRFADLGETKNIDRAVGDFGEALATRSGDVKRAGRALDELVMRPVRALLGDTRRVLLAPDGELNLVPFGALVDEEGRYLVERYSITYITSGRDLLRMRDRAPSRGMPIVIANPAFDLEGKTVEVAALRADNARGRRSGDLVQRWAPLKGTGQEAEALKHILSKAQVLEGAQATESALKRVAGPQVLHVATHGFFLPDQPPEPAETTGEPFTARRAPVGENPLLRSGLVLAGANTHQGGGGEDGILTALEAAGLDLWGTKLVVLSACETGVGEAKSGEGVYGLRRSLVLAGAESQLMSLWQVDDKATHELMVAYYKRLLAGEGRSEALRQVQLEMLKRSGVEHPHYWAAFIPIGDWRNLNEEER